MTTGYLIDTLNSAGLPQVMDELQNGAVTRTYAYGLERISENQLIGGTWTTSFYGYDGHGSTRFLTNMAGSVTDTYQYDAFGNVISSTGSTPNEFLFAGEQFDPALGFYYMRARYYRPATGRFWSMDPILGEGVVPLTLSPYGYASDDPPNLVDATGEAAAAPAIPYPQEKVSGGAFGEYVALAGIAVASITAVLALACEVSARYAISEKKFENDLNVTQEGCGAQGEGRMRLQLQFGSYTSTVAPPNRAITNPDPPGVTTTQVRERLYELWSTAPSEPRFPFNSLRGGLRRAIVKISKCVGMYPPYGTPPFELGLCTAPVGRGWRIDLDQLNGTNLRQ